MGAGDLTYSSEHGTVFIQPGGPGTPMYWLGNCYDVDDIEAPAGEITIRQCRDAFRQWQVVGQSKAQPEMVTTTLTGLSRRTRDWLQKLRCDGLAALYVLQSTCVQQDIPTNYDTALVLQRINVVSRTFGARAMRGDAEDATFAAEIQAWPPLIEAYPVGISRLTTTEVNGINDVWSDRTGECGDCAEPREPGELALAAPDSSVGPATGNVLYSTDGIAWAFAAADPFGAGLHVMSVQSFMISATTRRWVVAKQGVVATQGQVAFSDNSGASWTVVSVGGAAAGHGPIYGRSLWMPAGNFGHLASRLGYIYRSVDNGQTWTATESGVITIGDYSGIHFSDDKHGAAVAAAGVVAVTENGGDSWEAATVINAGAAGNLTVHVFDDKRIQVGDDAGKLWQSTDFGVTWTEITGWSGSGAGDVRSLDYVNDFVGFMAYNSAAPVGAILRTIDGGSNWTVLENIPTNVGLNSLYAVTENLAYAVGEAQGGTGVILKVSED